LFLMMQWKTTGVLLAVTVGLGAYLSLHELSQPSREERERRSSRILDLPEASVTRLLLESSEGRVVLARDGTAWRLSPPSTRPSDDSGLAQDSRGIRADPGRISGILNALDPLTATRTLTGTKDHPLDSTTYGLSPPVAKLTVQASGALTTILIGETTPIGSHRYARVDDRPEVAVVPSTLFEALRHPAEWFRDPLLLRFSAWQITELAITSPAGSVTLTLADNAWRLTQPLEDRADRAAVTTLLDRLGERSIARTVAEHPSEESLAQWGLEPPRAQVTLRQEQDAATLTALFGNPLGDDPSSLAAKRGDEAPVYAVAAAELAALWQDPAQWRERRCFDFFSGQVTKAEWTQGEARWTIEQSEGQWTLAGSSEPLTPERVEEWLDRLRDLRVNAFVEDAPSDLARDGLEPPFGTISVWTNTAATPQRLLVGSPREGTTERYGRIEGRAAVVSLPGSVSELPAATPDAWR
jgi:hypothetical protein